MSRHDSGSLGVPRIPARLTYGAPLIGTENIDKIDYLTLGRWGLGHDTYSSRIAYSVQTLGANNPADSIMGLTDRLSQLSLRDGKANRDEPAKAENTEEVNNPLRSWINGVLEQLPTGVTGKDSVKAHTTASTSSTTRGTHQQASRKGYVEDYDSGEDEEWIYLGPKEVGEARKEGNPHTSLEDDWLVCINNGAAGQVKPLEHLEAENELWRQQRQELQLQREREERQRFVQQSSILRSSSQPREDEDDILRAHRRRHNQANRVSYIGSDRPFKVYDNDPESDDNEIPPLRLSTLFRYYVSLDEKRPFPRRPWAE